MDGMTTQLDFLEYIAKNPNEGAIRLIYADWLEEKGIIDELTRLRGPIIPRELDDSDWMQTFGPCGGEKEADGNVQGTPVAAPPHSKMDLTPFGRKDVRRIIALQGGEADAKDWLCIGELWDGRFFTVRAGCDYTGWD